MDERRAEQIGEIIREELMEIIGFEMADPRLAPVDVTAVVMSPDMRQARVLVALHGIEREQVEGMNALEHARQYLRHELARRLNLRKMPELHFEIDPWQETASRVEVLLRRAKKTRGKAENQP
ncbi:MAG: 30S ribosome-binding factor RbfA [Candidatus Solibacter usitatus]|nr:30S ribosome-binding factor RbfA [Candidatus Solibacter usitatus]